jgi:hypothetical protein
MARVAQSVISISSVEVRNVRLAGSGCNRAPLPFQNGAACSKLDERGGFY